VFDGRIARLTGATSSFGEAYDTLADVVSFGMAPAVLAVQWGLWERPRLGLAVAFLFLVAGSIRLARFQAHDMSHHSFEGLPIPAGASAVALMTLLSPRPVQGEEFPWIVAAFLLCLALLMVSKLPYRAFKDVDLKQKWPVTTLFAIAAVFSATVFAPAKVLALLLGIYILSAPVALVLGLVPRRKTKRTNRADSDDDTKESTDVEPASPDLPA
jgi:CDP-diacylglycerol--serine O-phosphatidyltransferase